MNDKNAFCVLLLAMTILSNKFIVVSLNDFYRFELDKTVKTTGVLTKAYLYEGIGTTEYQCDILFYHNNSAYNFSDDIPYRASMNYRKADSIDVIYNLRNPVFATINSSENRYFSLFACLFLVLSSIYSIVFFTKAILSFIRKKTGKLSS